MTAGKQPTDNPEPVGTRKDEPEASPDAEAVPAPASQADRPNRESTKPPGTRGHVSDHLSDPSGGAGDA